MMYSSMYYIVSKFRNRHFMLFDLFIIVIAPVISLYIRLDGSINFDIFGWPLVIYILVFSIPKLFVLYGFGLYRRVWKTASIDEMARLIVIGLYLSAAQIMLFILLHLVNCPPVLALPHSLALLDGIISITFICSLRFSIRLLERANHRSRPGDSGTRVLVIGAGFAGVSIMDELQRNPRLGMNPVAFADDDPLKKYARIRGVVVAGDTHHIPDIVAEHRVDKVIIAMPSAPGSKIRRIVNQCSMLNLETLTVPGIFEILNGRISIDTIRKISVDDLLRRAPIRTDSKAVTDNTRFKKIIVTGAGGSIGSEICRQLIKKEPSELVLLGHGENSIFEIEQELNFIKKNYPVSTNIRSVIADIQDQERIFEIFAEVRPDIIYHAAAHKHVPLMELNPKEAIKNNIAGTKNLVDAAVRYNVMDFVLISSDKAVNPTNIMGATKRAAEMIVLDAAKKYWRRYTAVRFGNVLGSRGSVLHTFKRQISNGGPVTITHPDIRRFFMTIPEAVQLVLQAAVLGKGGEIFMLDMGEPIKLIDLAKDVIRLSGLKEGYDIKLDIIGLRPGEKLFEELFIKGEIYEKTNHEKVLIAKNASNFVNKNLAVQVSDLIFNISDINIDQVYARLGGIVPEFNPVFLKKKSELPLAAPKEEINVSVA